MGYMGFGLRKEDYKRKPKTVFNKQKELYGDKLEKYLDIPAHTDPSDSGVKKRRRMRLRLDVACHSGGC